MALGIYLQPGSLKTPSSIYVGAGGVHNVKEVYVGVGGTAHKAWPAFTDYGGDIVELMDAGLITYGYWQYPDEWQHSRNNGGLHTGLSVGTSNACNADSSSGGTDWMNRCYLTDPDEGSSYTYGDCDHWFPSQQPMDLRGYNYLAAYIRPWYGYGSTSNYATPFFSIGESITSIPSTEDSPYILGDRIRSTSGIQGIACSFYLYVDLSNCNLENAYIKVGAYLSASGSITRWGYINLSSIYLYKDSSDDPYASNSGEKQYLTY